MATTISSSTSSTVTTQGVGSGLDIAAIVDKLMTVEQAPLNRLQKQESAYQTKLSAFSAARGVLSTFQNSVSSLAAPTAFSSFTAKIADETVAGISVDPAKSGQLSAGTHTLRVDHLATSQRVAGGAIASPSTPLGTGTMTIELGAWDSTYGTFTPNGTAGSKSITIDASNNTLSGIRDAINKAGAGVTASIVNDGTGNRLVLSGTSTGAANGFRITTVDADGNNTDASGLSQLAFDPAGGTTATSHLADATDARFSLDGLMITKPSNKVTDVIDGLTLDLKDEDATTTTTFTIARDTDTAKKNINAFVSAYNGVMGNLGTLTGYNPTTKASGVLNGDASMRMVASKIQSIAASVIPTGGNATMLADIGIKFTSAGTLEVEDAKLTAALASDPDSIGRLFSKTATPSDALVSYTNSTDKTQAGAHTLAVSTLASQGGMTGSAAPGQTITAGVNDTFDITVDNVSTTITLSPGTYASAGDLGTAIQSRVNGDTKLSKAGASVSVGVVGGALQVTSQRFGSASSVVLGSGNASAGLFGTPTSTSGADVAGTIDGIAFLGSGQKATGAKATSAEGLELTIAGGAIGSRGTVSFNRGLAAQLDDMLTTFLGDDGPIKTATDGINASIKTVQKSEDDWNTRLIGIKARLTAQYNAMDSLVASLNNTSTYLTQQLEALNKSTSK